MKHVLFFSCVVLLMINLFSYEWHSFGPIERINDYECTQAGEIFAVDDGLWIGWDELEHFSYGAMPVTEIFQSNLSAESVFTILKDGSWSDGIYTFNLNDHNFTVLDFMYQPNFIEQCGDYIYVGHEYGLKRSTDGIEWEDVTFFNQMRCGAMAISGDNMIVSKTDMPTALYISEDNGVTWEQSSFIVTNLPLTDFAYCSDSDLTLYGVFPGYSNSSGLWKSTDFGDHWNVVSYTSQMECIYSVDNYLFTGWHDSDQGVAMLNFETSELIFMNDGLNNTQIVNFSCNDMIDCINIVACTENGAYICYDFSNVSSFSEQIPSTEISVMNYPNPFNPNTTFSLKLPVNLQFEFCIYNTKGQEIFHKTGFTNKKEQQEIIWNAESQPNGIYFYQLKTEDKSQTGKCLLLK